MILNVWLVLAGVTVATWTNHLWEPDTVGIPQPLSHAPDTRPSENSPRAKPDPTRSKEKLERFKSSQTHMGTQFILILYAPEPELANRAFAAASQRIETLNRTLSDYVSDSELNRLSRTAPTPQEVALSHDLFRVLDRSQEISRLSRGGFDVTVGPLTKLWRRARRREKLPADDRLKEARAAVGYRFIELNAERQTARLTQPNMRLDLGGIAKGFAVDEALAELSRHGISRALVNAGGDVAASGPPPNAPGWRVALAPLQPDAEPSVFGNLAHQAIATSGDAFQYVEIDGVRYSHIVDPRTGLGLTDRSSVSILAPDCMTADALASAASVLGPRDGMALVERLEKVEAFILFDHDDRISTFQSSKFSQRFSLSDCSPEK